MGPNPVAWHLSSNVEVLSTGQIPCPIPILRAIIYPGYIVTFIQPIFNNASSMWFLDVFCPLFILCPLVLNPSVEMCWLAAPGD